MAAPILQSRFSELDRKAGILPFLQGRMIQEDFNYVYVLVFFMDF